MGGGRDLQVKELVIAGQVKEAAFAKQAKEPASARSGGPDGGEEVAPKGEARGGFDSGASDDAASHVLQAAVARSCKVARNVSFGQGKETRDFEFDETCKLMPTRSRRLMGKLEDTELVKNAFKMQCEFKAERWSDVDDEDGQ